MRRYVRFSLHVQVDLDEFVGLYAKIKAGDVDGLAGYGFFERHKKKGAAAR
jgi:hypothetical protein